MTTLKRLPNGLRVIVQESHAAPVTALNLWVGSGAFDDTDELAGISHLIEHMLFKKGEGVSRRDLAATVQGCGGYVNAATSHDYTMYYQVVPSEHWDEVLGALAEAVGTPSFDPQEIESEKSVVIEEARTDEIVPESFLWRRVMEAAYGVHPARRRVVGTEESISRIGAGDIDDHYRRHYTAGNMILVVAGDVDTDEVLDRAGDCLSVLGPADRPQRAFRAEPERGSLRALTLAGEIEQTYLAVVFHAPHVLHEDIPALDALSALLGLGRSSRLVRSLRISKGLVSSISSSVMSNRELGLFAIRATPIGQDADRTIEEIFREIEKLRLEYPSQAEMDKVISRLESTYAKEHETVEGAAVRLGLFEQAGDYRYAEEYIDRLARVGPKDIVGVAERYLGPTSATIVSYVPAAAGLPGGDRSDAVGEMVQHATTAPPAAVREAPRVWRPRRFERPLILAESSGTPCERFPLADGGTAVIAACHAVPLVSIAIGFRGGSSREPAELSGVAYLTQKLLTRGTRTRTAEELADHVEGLGSTITTSQDRDGFGVGISVLSRHFEEALSILSDVIVSPLLAAEDVPRARSEVEAEMREIEDNPFSHVMLNLAHLVFAGHPYARPLRGTRETALGLDCEQVRAWHRSAYTAANVVVSVVGDIERDHALSEIEHALSPLEAGRPIAASEVAPEVRGSRVDIERKGTVQSCVAVGFGGPRADGADSIVMRTALTALSMMGGRLWTSIRERPPFAYVVNASLAALKDGGACIAYATTPPGQEEVAVETLVEEFRRLSESGLDPEELERAKRYLSGTHIIALQRGAARAAAYGMAEVLEVGCDYVDRVPELVSRVDNDDVMRVVRRYVDVDNFAAVVRSAGQASLS